MNDTEALKSILLVEDDLQDVQLILAAFEQHHLADRVFVVHDGAEALDYLYCRGEFAHRLRCHPVLVLLDLKMPKVDGLEVLKIIKGDEMLKAIPRRHAVIFTRNCGPGRVLPARGQRLCGQGHGLPRVYDLGPADWGILGEAQ